MKVSWDDEIPNIWKFIKKMFQPTKQKTVYSLVYVHPTFLIPTKPQPAVTASGGKITNKRGYQQKKIQNTVMAIYQL